MPELPAAESAESDERGEKDADEKNKYPDAGAVAGAVAGAAAGGADATAGDKYSLAPELAAAPASPLAAASSAARAWVAAGRRAVAAAAGYLGGKLLQLSRVTA